MRCKACDKPLGDTTPIKEDLCNECLSEVHELNKYLYPDPMETLQDHLKREGV